MNREKVSLKAIAFDCDGVLIDSEPAHYLAWKHAFQSQGYNLSLDEYRVHAGNSTDFILKHLALKAGCNRLDEILKDKRAYYHQLQSQGLPPIKSTVDFVRLLSLEKERLDLRLIVVSSARRETILSNLRHLGLEFFFDLVISGQDDLNAYSDPEGINKPKPYIYLHAAQALGFDLVQCVAIEDSCTGVTAAKEAGYFTIAAPNHITRSQEFSHADLVVTTFANLSPDDFLRKISSLLRAKQS